MRVRVYGNVFNIRNWVFENMMGCCPTLTAPLGILDVWSGIPSPCVLYVDDTSYIDGSV